jgi:outer membrane lipoprotein carrier protein
MRRKMRSASLFCAFFVFSSALLKGQSADLHQIADRVDAHYNHLTSLRLDYTERYSGMGQSRTETGTLLLKKPGRMRWNYASPAGKVFILNSKYAWFYTPGDPQAQRVAAKQLDDLRSPLRFLLGRLKIEKELTNLTLETSQNSAKIKGVPKGMEQRVSSMTLTCNAISGILTGLKIEDADGSTTEFAFTNLQENVPLSDGDFQFVAPAGVTVIEGMPPS